MSFCIWSIVLLGLVILSGLNVTTSSSPKKVSLTWKRDGGHLCFSCDVKNLSLGVSFEDPHGNTRGHCTAPIPHTVAGHCDSHLKQNIFNETTVLMVDRLDCENGLWTCFHGENTNEYATASVSVSVDSKEKKDNDGDVPLAPSCGVYLSQLVRYGSVCCCVGYFIERNQCITDSKDIETISGVQRYLCALASSAIGYVIALVLFLLLVQLVQRNGVRSRKQFWTTDPFLTPAEVVMPLLISCGLSVAFMYIPGIGKGKWWIICLVAGMSALSTVVVLLISGCLRKQSLNESSSSTAKNDTSELLPKQENLGETEDRHSENKIKGEDVHKDEANQDAL